MENEDLTPKEAHDSEVEQNPPGNENVAASHANEDPGPDKTEKPKFDEAAAIIAECEKMVTATVESPSFQHKVEKLKEKFGKSLQFIKEVS